MLTAEQLFGYRQDPKHARSMKQAKRNFCAKPHSCTPCLCHVYTWLQPLPHGLLLHNSGLPQQAMLPQMGIASFSKPEDEMICRSNA